ncbi:MAG: phosphate acyltransferase [Planctomycetota bacterium]
MIRIVLDATGGDDGLGPNVEGAKIAIETGLLDSSALSLVGPEEELRREVGRQGLDPSVEIVDAPDRLNGESPVDALRFKKGNPIAVGLRLLKEGRASGFVSAGSTGHVVASATTLLDRLPNVRRPGIAATIKSDHGPVTVIDVGANPEPRADDLVQYALMATAHSKNVLGLESPRVGLMNIGSEDEKGHPLVRQVRSQLSEAAEPQGFRFVGNVEGGDVFQDVCDVIVCDGFTGNVLLKVSEGCAEFVLRGALRAMKEVGIEDSTCRDVASRLRTRIDYAEYGGALLLGVDGVVTICHGRSNGSAIANALDFTARSVLGACEEGRA